jgi:phospholipid-translocating ATPase
MWNEFADGKLLYYNKQLLHLVQHRQDRVVQEFWRLLAICHTVMVQEKDSECVAHQALPLLLGEGSQDGSLAPGLPDPA